MQVGGQLHSPAALPAGTNRGAHWVGGSMGPREYLGVLGKKKPLAFTEIWTPYRPVRILVVVPPELVRIVNGSTAWCDWTITDHIRQRSFHLFCVYSSATHTHTRWVVGSCCGLQNSQRVWLPAVIKSTASRWRHDKHRDAECTSYIGTRKTVLAL